MTDKMEQTESNTETKPAIPALLDELWEKHSHKANGYLGATITTIDRCGFNAAIREALKPRHDRGEPTYCKHINNGKEIHIPVVDGECPECRARAVERAQPEPASVEPQRLTAFQVAQMMYKHIDTFGCIRGEEAEVKSQEDCFTAYYNLVRDETSSVEPQVEPSNPPGCICEFQHPSCSYCKADSVSHPPLEQVAAPSGESLSLELRGLLDECRSGVEGNYRRMKRALKEAKGVLSRTALEGAIESSEKTLKRIAEYLGEPYVQPIDYDEAAFCRERERKA